MVTVCCVCTGRHHPLACPVAVRALDQCADPTPDDYTPTGPTASPLALVVDLDDRRSAVDAATASARRADRHRAAAQRRWRA